MTETIIRSHHRVETDTSPQLSQRKRSNLGTIPEEWDPFSLDELASVIDGDRGSNYPSNSDFGADGHCLFLNAGNVTRGGFRFEECAFIDREKDAQLSKGKLVPGDIVLTTRGISMTLCHSRTFALIREW